jgi:hypothetical protein
MFTLPCFFAIERDVMILSIASASSTIHSTRSSPRPQSHNLIPCESSYCSSALRVYCADQNDFRNRTTTVFPTAAKRAVIPSSIISSVCSCLIGLPPAKTSTVVHTVTSTAVSAVTRPPTATTTTDTFTSFTSKSTTTYPVSRASILQMHTIV